MSHDDGEPKRPKPPALDDTQAPDSRDRPKQVELEDTLAAGSSDSRMKPGLEQTAAANAEPGLEATFAVGSKIRPPPKPVTETVGGDGDDAAEVAEQRIDRYVIKRRLGQGGMGVVYQATDSELGRDVAIKVIKSGASADRLKREAQALARLDHANVVTVYDVGEHEGRVFVAMELVDGATLHQWCDGAERTTAEVMRVLFAAADGIIAAHTAGLIHRDLKPDNIFVGKDGSVQVGDFGLARDTDDDDGNGFPTQTPAMSLTQTGHVLGTPAYMAPEQADGDATERSDQFSFCVTAYEALYGTRPFVGATFQEILDRVDSGSIEAPRRRRKVPAQTARAIRRGLSADPALRWGSMKELVAAMRPRARRPWGLIAGAALLVAAAVTVTIVVAKRDHGSGAAAACDSTASTDLVWYAKRRSTLADALRARELPASAITNVDRLLGNYVEHWSKRHRETCIAQSSHQIEARASTARSACESFALSAFDEIARSIETDAALDAIDAALRVSGLPDVDACASDDVLKLFVTTAEHEHLMRDLVMQPWRELSGFAELRARAEAANDLAGQLAVAMAEGHRALTNGSYVEAEAAFQRAMPLTEQLDASAARAHVLAMSARVRCEQGKDPESYLVLAEAAAKRLDPIRNADDVIAVLWARGVCLMRKPDPAPAIPVFEELLARIQQNNAGGLDDAAARSELAITLHRIGRNDDAAVHEAAVLTIVASFTNDTMALATKEANASNAAFMAGDLQQAIRHQERAIQLFPRLLLKAQGLSGLAMYYDVLADYKAAVATHEQVVTILATLPPSALIDHVTAESLTYGGSDRLYLDDIDGARQRLELALPLATKLDNVELIAVCQLGLGRAWLAQKEFVRAAKFLQDGLTTHAKLGDAAQFRVGIGLFALAQAHWALGDTHAARETARRAEQATAKGLDQARENPLGAFGLPFKQARYDEIVHWRETHK